MPRVSVCTSVLNQSDYLKRMIGTVQAQTFTDWELVIVDDGSTEDIRGLVEALNDPRLVYVRFPENRGIPHGLNYAMAFSTGEYLQPLSADEFIEPNKLAVQVAWLDAHPNIDCVWGIPGKAEQGMGERPTWEQFALKAHNRSREAWVRTLLNLEQIPIGGASMLMRRSAFDDIGGFDPQLFMASDLEWFVRFFKKHDGFIMPYRFADADQPETRLTAPRPGLQESFQADMAYVRAKHALELPPGCGHVTVGIPVYNMAAYVPFALQSVFAQTFQDFDVIVLDDGSTDATLAIVQQWAAANLQPDDTRLKIVQFDENRGTVAAINHMAAVATGEFYVSLAADDILDPTFLARCLAEFEKDRWLEFVASQTDFIDAAGAPYVEDHPFKNIVRAANKTRDQWLGQLYYGNQYFGVGMYRTKLLREVGGWNPEFGVLTDYEMYLRLLQRENIFVIEENLTHTRIHGEQKSLLNTVEARKLKQRYHDARLAYYQPRMKVIIMTPFYNMQGFSPYIVSLGATIQYLTRFGIEHEFWELSGDSYVDRAKTTLFNKFLEDPDATDLFMIDSDMQWNAAAFMQMLALPEEIVMASYPQKNMWDVWTARPVLVDGQDGKQHPIGRALADGSGLLQAAYMAGGFIRIKRSVLEKFRDHYPDLRYYDPGADPSYPDRLYVDFFHCEVAKNEAGQPLRWGEDRVFGKRIAEMGIQAWIYPKVDVGHYGIKGWTGNYDTYLRQAPKEAA